VIVRFEQYVTHGRKWWITLRTDVEVAPGRGHCRASGFISPRKAESLEDAIELAREHMLPESRRWVELGEVPV
jgi:hypothetical protein